MPYDKETRDALQAYYEAHDFTGNISVFDDKKYTPAQLQIYAKAKKFFAQFYHAGKRQNAEGNCGNARL